jgi:hypothetical protein
MKLQLGAMRVARGGKEVDRPADVRAPCPSMRMYVVTRALLSRGLLAIVELLLLVEF